MFLADDDVSTCGLCRILVEMANAFLLGRDLRALATAEDSTYVEKFLGRLLSLEDGAGAYEDDFTAEVFRRQKATVSPRACRPESRIRDISIA